ncbi:MAG: helix-turn-helix transcriptional regulator [Chloroflexi bacterium]|nr:helix-turn-helix transcriptional regulator [Chloroflexota bacterium]
MGSTKFHAMCPRYEEAFQVLGRRWTGLILRALVDQPRRFCEITAYVPGLSDRLLSERLKELEDAGIVERRVRQEERPVLVEYSLTDKGRALRPVLQAVQRWADQWVEAAPTGSPGDSS